MNCHLKNKCRYHRQCFLDLRHPNVLMIRYLLLLVILFYLPLDCTCLTEGEIGALKSILSIWPSLETASPPWTEWNISLACNKPFAFGLSCSEGPDPHVIGMYVIL
jgi:hypothetical protein